MFFACVRKIIGNSHSVIGAMSFARCFLETRVEDQRKHYIVWLGRCFWHLGALPTQRATWKSRVHYYPLGSNARGSEKSAGGELICHFSYHQVACIRTQSHYSTRWVFTSESILSAYQYQCQIAHNHTELVIANCLKFLKCAKRHRCFSS